MKKLFHLFYLLPLALCLNSTAYATASGAAATVTVENGAVTAITVSSGGTGYDNAPTIFLLDTGGGTGASATATVSGGAVTGVSVSAGGSGYTESSTQVIFLPNVSDIGDAPSETPTDVPTETPSTDDLPDAPDSSPSSGGIAQVAIDDPDLSMPFSGTRIINISTRGKVIGDTDDDALVGGFVVKGEPGTTITVIVRGLGPYMSQLGAIDSSVTLSDPTLELRDASNTKIAGNDNWKVQESASDPDPAGLQASTYAPYTTSFAGVGLQDNEAAILIDLPIYSEAQSQQFFGTTAYAGLGIYTAVVKGSGGTTGIGQVAIDDPDLSESGTSNRIINISTRGYVGSGENEDLVGGFVIRGTPGASKNFILRGLGPYMALTTGSDIFIEDPFMQVQNSAGAVVYNNDNWATRYSSNDPDPSTSLNSGDYSVYTTSFAGVGLQEKEAGLLLPLTIEGSGYGINTNSVKLTAP